MNLEEQPDLKGVRIDRRSHVPAGFVPGASSHVLCLCSVNLLKALLGYPGLAAAAAAAASLWKAREKPHKTRMCEQKHQDVCMCVCTSVFPKISPVYLKHSNRTVNLRTAVGSFTESPTENIQVFLN